MKRSFLNRLGLLAATALLGVWAPEAQAQCTPPATVQAAVVRDGNDLVVRIKPSANVPGTEYIAGMTLTVKYTDDANVSLGTPTWASAGIGQAWDGFFATTFSGQANTVSNGGFKYTTYVTENPSLGLANLATAGVTLSANTELDLLRIPLTITNNACAVFSVENDAYTGNNNLDWYIAFSGCDAQNGFYGTAVAPVVNENSGLGYCTIQSAIDAAQTLNGHTIRVAAGTFVENVVINKELALRGANYGVNPNTGTRGPETVVMSATVNVTGSSTSNIISVRSSNVTIDGFMVDGDNPNLTSGFTNPVGADMDIRNGIANSLGIQNLRVENNIVKNILHAAVRFASTSGLSPAVSTGHVIRYNRLQDLGTYQSTGTPEWSRFGLGVLAENSAYAQITDNVMLNVRGGVQTGNYQQPNPTSSFVPAIANNEIQTRKSGVMFNLHNYSPWSVANNTITGLSSDAENAIADNIWYGIRALSLGNAMGTTTFSTNNIDGSAVTAIGTVGVGVWNVKSDSKAEIAGGVIQGVDTGVDINNFEAYGSNATNGAHAILSGVSITADNIGVRVWDSPSSTTHASVSATVANCFIQAGTTGILAAEVQANAASLTANNNSITGQSGKAINSGASNLIDATCNWFGGASAATVQAAVSGNVTVIPWLNDGTDNELATAGFQPAAGTCIGQPFTLSATSLNVNCNGAADGSIDLTVTGGVAPFTYAWTNSATTQDLSALAPGTYNVTVTDSLGTTGTLATAITISEPAAVVLSASATPILCFGGTSELTASATGADSLRVNGVLYTAAISGLTPGAYTVIAYGTNGNNNGVCTDTEVVTITQPALLEVSTSVTDATCNTNSDGEAVATATGGTAPYGYSWNDGAAQTTATATGLAVGAYTVTVTDDNGCTANTGATIGQVAHSGSTWYVATTGSNSNNGNAGCPVQTIQFAINSATAGDVVDVAAGTYTEQVSLNKANITLQSADGNATTFIENPSVGSETAGVTAVANMGTLTVDGFTVNNFRNGIIQGMASATGTTFIVRNNKVIPENNATNPYLRNGIQVTGNGSQVLNNYVVGAPLTSTWASTGIGVVNASNALVEGNTVNTASADIGINVLNYNVDAVNGVTVRNNTVHNAKNGIRLEGGPVATGAPRKLVSNTLIERNVLTNSPTSSGINAQSVAVEGLTVTGNIITGHTQYAVRFSNTTAVLSGVISINENILTGTIGGLFNGPGYAINATCNWWGSDVPADVLGDILGGGNVTFIPWLLDDSDLSASIGFLPGGACAGYPVTLTARAVLSGAYVTATGLMRDDLRSLLAFPTTEPYTALGFTDVTVTGPLANGVLDVNGGDAIVDWVLVEVRDAATPATVLHRRAALMQRDGDIVDVDGSTPIYVWTLARDNYHVAVRHRNHLGAMTASSQFLGNAPSLIDFRSIATFGTEAQRQLVPGVSGLWEGNTRNNTRIAYTGANNDRDPILLALPAPSPTSVRLDVYNQADVNLDGDVKYTGANNDRAPILSNIGGNVPTAVRLQQLP